MPVLREKPLQRRCHWECDRSGALRRFLHRDDRRQEAPIVECENCNTEAFVLAEERCAGCGYSIPIRLCGECEVPIGEDDFLRHDGRCVPCFLAAEMSH